MINAVMSREDFSRLVKVVSAYDPFACYIDDYSSQRSVEKANESLNAKFAEILSKYVPGTEDLHIFVTNCENKGVRTCFELKKWLESTHQYKQWSITIEADPRQVGCRRSYLVRRNARGDILEAIEFVDDYRPELNKDERYAQRERSYGCTWDSSREHFATKQDGNDAYTQAKEFEGFVKGTEADYRSFINKMANLTA